MLLAGHTATRQLKAHAPTCGAQRHIATLSPGCQHTSQTDSRPCHLHVQPLLQVDSTRAGTSWRAHVQPWGSEDLAIPAALVLCHPPLWLCNVLMWLSTSLETPATMGHTDQRPSRSAPPSPQLPPSSDRCWVPGDTLGVGHKCLGHRRSQSQLVSIRDISDYPPPVLP